MEYRARTLGGYKGYIEIVFNSIILVIKHLAASTKLYLMNLFPGQNSRKYRDKPVNNESVKKYFVPLKMICKDAAIKYGWGGMYDPFFGFEMPKSDKDAYEKIFPFSVEEQDRIIANLPDSLESLFQVCLCFGNQPGRTDSDKTRSY